ncbi:MAG TPA: alcohol dehydrogenase catalytic domain-containing protein [Acidimicrobiales bacterium]|nr:alcohol dehydrogenase catalytic domain-containing protein [Acidimicrobiales bacterium]
MDDPTLPGADAVIVRITRTAICGSDLHLYHGIGGGPGVHLGHEFVGEVVEAGPDVRRFRVGDRVLVSGVIGCGACDGCRAGDPVRCVTGPKVFGTNIELPGGQAEYAAVPAADMSLHLIPEAITDEAAVLLTDILPTGYFGARNAEVGPGDTVVVIGLGPVGVFALQSAQLLGAARVLAVDVVPERLAHAARLGAIPVDASAGTHAQILELTGGLGADAVIEAVGADATVHDALLCARAGGRVSVIGVNINMEFPFPMALAFFRDLTFRIGLCPIQTTWPELVPVVAAGRIRPEEIVTHRMGLSEVAEAYRRFDAREDGVLKVMLDPTA